MKSLRELQGPWERDSDLALQASRRLRRPSNAGKRGEAQAGAAHARSLESVLGQFRELNYSAWACEPGAEAGETPRI